jgi:hypothetical protein
MANQYTSELTNERKAALHILGLGLATVGELANQFRLPRQTVQRWADVAGIDVASVRGAKVAALVEAQLIRSD